MCIQLDNIDKSELIEIVTKLKLSEKDRKIAELEKENKQLKSQFANYERALVLMVEWVKKNINKNKRQQILDGLEDTFIYSFIKEAEKELRE